MLRPDGYVKVLDFGLARLSALNDAQSETATDAGTVLGTARYMSPEQARGEATEAPSDVFSMGIVFYELIWGAHPFYSAATRRAMTSPGRGGTSSTGCGLNLRREPFIPSAPPRCARLCPSDACRLGQAPSQCRQPGSE